MNTQYLYRKLSVDSSLLQVALTEWAKNHQDKFYDIDTRREKFSPGLSKTRSYPIRRTLIASENFTSTESTQNIVACMNTQLAPLFPAMLRLVNELAKNTENHHWTQLGRIFVTRLTNDENIGRHIDDGLYFDTLRRIHIPLIADGKASFCWDDGTRLQMNVGEVWEVNNSIPHWVENKMGSDRTHCIFDAV